MAKKKTLVAGNYKVGIGEQSRSGSKHPGSGMVDAHQGLHDENPTAHPLNIWGCDCDFAKEYREKYGEQEMVVVAKDDPRLGVKRPRGSMPDWATKKDQRPKNGDPLRGPVTMGQVVENHWQLPTRVQLTSDRWVETEQIKEGGTYFVSDAVAPVLTAMSEGFPDIPITAEDLPSPSGFLQFESVFRFSPNSWLDAVMWRSDESSMTVTSWINIGKNASNTEVFISTLNWHFGDNWDADWALDEGGHEGHEVVTSDGMALQRRLTLVLFYFMKQRIGVIQERRPARAERRGLERKFHEDPVLKVVELRRRRAPFDYERLEGEIEYSCRWMVTGHWHKYWLGTGDDRRLVPQWLAPYVKGPEDMPLKEPKTVIHSVVR